MNIKATAALAAALITAPPVLASSELVVATEPIQFGIPVVTILVDGPNGGTVDWDNTGVADPWPEGACGFRVKGNNMPGDDGDPEDVGGWGWYGGYTNVQGDLLPIANNGIDLPDHPGSYLEFTGPYGDNCEDGYVFHTPATPTSLPPATAIGLVIQFYDWDDIVFLDSGFQPFEVPDNPWGPDPDFEPPFDICEEAPWLCEGPSDFQSCFWIETFDGWENNCPDGGGESGRIADLVLAASWGVSEVERFVGTTGSGEEALLPIYQAQQKLQSARVLLEELGEIERYSRDRKRQIQLGRIAANLSQAERQLEACQKASERLSQSRDPRREAPRAAERCGEAASSLGSAHDAARAFRFLLGAQAPKSPNGR